MNTFYPPQATGGAEESVAELAEELRGLGHEVAVVSLDPEKSSSGRSESGVILFRLRCPAVRVYAASSERAKLSRLLWQIHDNFRLGVFLALRRVFKTFRPDIVHTNALGGFGVTAWAVARKIPTVHTAREFGLVCISGKAYRNGSNCRRQCAACYIVKRPYAVKSYRPRLLVGLSRDTLSRLEVLVPSIRFSESTVVYNQPLMGIISGVNSRDSAGLRFGYIGRIASHKGVAVIVKAFSRITIADASLTLAGDIDADMVSFIKMAIAQDPRISWLGRVPKASFFSQVDTVLVPSQWHEPFGRVAAEGGAYNRRVLVSNVGGLPEFIDLAAGDLVVDDFSSPSAWRATMESTLSSEPTQIPRSHRPNALRPVGRQYERLYRRVLAASSSPVRVDRWKEPQG